MPRNRRLDIPGAIHHVIVRGLERRRIFKNNDDYSEFISRLEKSIKYTTSFCYAWALMPNHVHLLIRTGEKSLSDLMRSVLTGYAVYFNRKNKRHGYLYQNRYKSILCQEEPYLLKLVAYIHLNPLRVRIVKDFDELAKYKWCGHGVIMGKAKNEWQDSVYILSMFDRRIGKARSKYIEFVKSQSEQNMKDQFITGGLRRSCGGWREVEQLKKNKEYWRGDERLLGDSSFVDKVLKASEEQIERRESLRMRGWTLQKVIAHTCAMFNVKESDILLKGKMNARSRAKSAICYLAHRDLGISGVEIGRRLGITKVAVSKNIRNGAVVVKEDGVKLTS